MMDRPLSARGIVGGLLWLGLVWGTIPAFASDGFVQENAKKCVVMLSMASTCSQRVVRGASCLVLGDYYLRAGLADAASNIVSFVRESNVGLEEARLIAGVEVEDGVVDSALLTAAIQAVLSACPDDDRDRILEELSGLRADIDVISGAALVGLGDVEEALVVHLRSLAWMSIAASSLLDSRNGADFRYQFSVSKPAALCALRIRDDVNSDGDYLSWVKTVSVGALARLAEYVRKHCPRLLPLPEIVQFGASPESIVSGETATISWVVRRATGVVLTPGGELPLEHSLVVGPSRTSEYTLLAVGLGGDVQNRLVVRVSLPPRVACEGCWWMVGAFSASAVASGVVSGVFLSKAESNYSAVRELPGYREGGTIAGDRVRSQSLIALGDEQRSIGHIALVVGGILAAASVVSFGAMWDDLFPDDTSER